MTLREYIAAQGWLSLPAAEVHRRMNETVVGALDDRPFTFSGIADLIGPEATTDLASTLTASGLGWCNEQLGGNGLKLSDFRVQEVLWSFEAAGKTWARTLRMKGIDVRTRYEHYVAAGECTLAMCEEAMA